MAAQTPNKDSDEISPETAETAADAPLEPVAAESSQGGDESFFAASPDVEVPDQPQVSEAEPRDRTPLPVREERRPAPRPPLPSSRPAHPAHPEAIRKAIDEVMEVIASLRESLDQMDEVLELLEEAERTKTADEREIETLRQQLRRFQRPPDEGPRQRPPVSSGTGHREPHRSQRDQRDQRDQRSSHRSPREQRPDLQKGHGSSGAAHRSSHAPRAEAAASSSAPGTPEAPAGEQPSSGHGTDAGDPS